ncbi:MAG: hypothetical protein HC875_03685 [Anaerolineales bacterium]|nr:hypothetical protein [Anaerolineales bacterium]
MAGKLCMNLHHASLLVADVDEAFSRYEKLLGMHGEKMDGYALMRCMHEDFCLILKPAGDQKPFLDYVAYELEPGLTLAEAAASLRRGAKNPKKLLCRCASPACCCTTPTAIGWCWWNAAGPKTPARR